jgi:hypothetical protein
LQTTLNKQTCELITTRSAEQVTFEDRTPIKQIRKATYLGCDIGIRATTSEELNTRFTVSVCVCFRNDGIQIASSRLKYLVCHIGPFATLVHLSMDCMEQVQEDKTDKKDKKDKKDATDKKDKKDKTGNKDKTDKKDNKDKKRKKDKKNKKHKTGKKYKKHKKGKKYKKNKTKKDKKYKKNKTKKGKKYKKFKNCKMVHFAHDSDDAVDPGFFDILAREASDRLSRLPPSAFHGF